MENRKVITEKIDGMIDVLRSSAVTAVRLLPLTSGPDPICHWGTVTAEDLNIEDAAERKTKKYLNISSLHVLVDKV